MDEGNSMKRSVNDPIKSAHLVGYVLLRRLWQLRAAVVLLLFLSLSCTGCIFAARHVIQGLNGSDSAGASDANNSSEN